MSHKHATINVPDNLAGRLITSLSDGQKQVSEGIKDIPVREAGGIHHPLLVEHFCGVFDSFCVMLYCGKLISFLKQLICACITCKHYFSSHQRDDNFLLGFELI
jgi:hypothetical protein